MHCRRSVLLLQEINFFLLIHQKLQHSICFKTNIAQKPKQRFAFGGFYRMKFPRHWSFISHTFSYGTLALTDDLFLKILHSLLVSQSILMYIFMYSSFKFVYMHHMLQHFVFVMKNVAIRGILSHGNTSMNSNFLVCLYSWFSFIPVCQCKSEIVQVYLH